jgi:hypothetical protein
VRIWAGRRRSRIPLAVVAALAVAVAAAGCGGDDENGTDTGAGTDNAQPPTKTVTVPPAKTTEETGTATSPSKGQSTTPSKGKSGGSPEKQPGGAGDEEPVRTEVVLTGKGGRIGPLLVKVPPFVSIHVVLRSGDGKPYVIAFGRGKILRVGPKGAKSSATYDGLRPGKRLNGAAVSGKVVIEASAEPGP